MTATSLPLQLERLSAGFAALTPSARDAGNAVARAAADALAKELGASVSIEALAVPGVPSPSLGTTALVFDLAARGRVVVEVDAWLASRVAAVLGGGDGDVAPARAVVPAERSALELLGLVALDAARSIEPVATLAPRLVRDEVLPIGALGVELTICVGALRGHARALVSRAALEGLQRSSGDAVPDIRVAAGLRRGTLTLSASDAEALGVGDVVLLDAGAAPDALGFPGGLVLSGQLDGDAFTVEERTMDEWNGSFPIALSVEIARVNVTLRDLAGLTPGGVLPLNVARDGKVTLRAGEVAVGRGELVEVDGALAVRIAAWDGCR